MLRGQRLILLPTRVLSLRIIVIVAALSVVALVITLGAWVWIGVTNDQYSQLDRRLDSVSSLGDISTLLRTAQNDTTEQPVPNGGKPADGRMPTACWSAMQGTRAASAPARAPRRTKSAMTMSAGARRSSEATLSAQHGAHSTVCVCLGMPRNGFGIQPPIRPSKRFCAIAGSRSSGKYCEG